jgi:hypothetical protein
MPLWTPVGALYLTTLNCSSSVTGDLALWDFLWVNSGIAVTTTTAQTINSVAWPARDLDGSTNGQGVNAAILVTTATTNAGAITNTTLSYTNQAGTAGRTATIASFPAAAVIGTIVPFQLAAGDSGIRSIQTITLGTSYGGGAISLVSYTIACSVGQPVANVGADKAYGAPGVRLYTGSCLLAVRIPSATTDTNVAGSISVIER